MLTFEPSMGDIARSLLWAVALVLPGIALEGALRLRGSWPGRIALGLAVSMLVLTVGVAIGAPHVAAWLCVAVGLGGVVWRWRALMPRELDLRDVIGMAAVAVAIVLLAPVLVRPHVNYDVLAYHLPIAHHFASGDLGYIAGNYYSRLPMGAAALSVPFLADRATTLDDAGVRALLLMAWLGGALLAGRIAGHLGATRGVRWMIVAAAALLPVGFGAMLNAHSDLLVALFALGALERLLASGGARGRDVAIVGFLGGSAIAVKFSALGIVAVPMLLGLLALAGRPIAWRRALLFGAMVLVAWGPWLVRAWMLGGHPLHPFMGEADGCSAAQQAFLVEQHDPRTPFSVVYWKELLRKAPVIGFAGFYSLVLLVVGLGLGEQFCRWTRRRKMTIAIVLGIIAAGLAAWCLVGWAPNRFLLHAPFVLLGVTGGMWGAMRRHVPAWRMFGGTFVLMMAWVVFGSFATIHRVPWLKAEWDASWPYPEGFIIAAHDELATGRTLMLFEARSRLFPADAVATSVWDVPPWADALRGAESAEDLARRLRAAGFTHLLVNEVELGRLVTFYAGQELRWQQGEVGLFASRERGIELLASYPPFVFAGLEEMELGALWELLDLSRRGSVRRMQGADAWLWFASLPEPMEDPTE